MKKFMEKDMLGTRLKGLEEKQNKAVLRKDKPIYARIDGRHFSSFTQHMGYQYTTLNGIWGNVSPRSGNFYHSFAMYNLMRKVASDLMVEFNADIVETHSDEISLAWQDGQKIPFDGKYFKLVSNMASYASASFMHHMMKYKEASELEGYCGEEYCDYIPSDVFGKIPSFDCRIFNVPNVKELANCFVWRQNDCIRGTLNQLSYCYFSHKELHGKTGRQRVEMLKEIGFEKYLASEEFRGLQNGSFFIKKAVVLPIDEKYKKFHPTETTMIRHKVFELFPGILSKSKNKVEKLFDRDCEDVVLKEVKGMNV